LGVCDAGTVSGARAGNVRQWTSVAIVEALDRVVPAEEPEAFKRRRGRVPHIGIDVRTGARSSIAGGTGRSSMIISPLRVGEAVPAFDLVDQDGAVLSLPGGRKTALVFYRGFW
jgi:hypothetical protein